jgi:hypothetical protein
VAQRFQIEDLVEQDASCVTFRAVDTTSGETVALRRFFPCGPDGPGLDADGQTRFREELDLLGEFRHPAFRKIQFHGCDPVDGMPFIASEWIAGSTLRRCLNSAALSPEMAFHLLDTALELSQQISETLAHEALWIEVGLTSIIVGNENSDRPLSFSISHLKWVSDEIAPPSGLEALIGLTESILAWNGLVVNDYSAKGLGAWFNWLNNTAQTATLAEAREKLASCFGTEPPKPMKRPARQSSKPPKKTAKKSRLAKARPAITAFVALSIFGLAGWLLVRHNSASLIKPHISFQESARLASTSALDAGMPEEPSLPAPALEGTPAAPEPLSLTPADNESKVAENSPAPAPAPAPSQARSDSAPEIFAASDFDRLLTQRNQIVTLEGTMESIGHSKSKSTLYLQFSPQPASLDPRVGVLVKSAPASLSEPELRSFIGKKLQITGKVRIDPVGKSFRPVVILQSPSDLKIVH